MKKIVREFEFNSQQENTVRSLAQALGITQMTAGILYARGIDTEEKMRVFLSPSKEHFLSPFLMRGMKEAVELIKQAKEEEWRVAVYGDYDVDGIGAVAVLSRALKRFGIEPYLFVPERTDGYGMSVAALDSIFDEFMPDLIITVDCGISNAEEVEYIKEQGSYVIVTDHHELPERLPDCITVNPKLKDDYPYDNLCGAGVAFKLATALLGESAYDLVDFAAISTVADSVPLLGENRDIVAEGLKRIEKYPRPAIAALLGGQPVSSQTISFTIAPRLNAAGRMGDARAALRLFTTDDEEEIILLAEKLNRYNAERQKYGAEMGTQAKNEVLRSGAYSNVVMLSDAHWNAGFLGIAAARIAEEFCRPTLMFVRHGDMLRGSARSIDNVNIFEALKACSEYIEEFGGHAQAAGVSVKAEKFEELKRALDEYIGSHYEREAFMPTAIVCGDGLGADRKFAHELDLLEPFGVGNRRPLFVAEVAQTEARLLKPESPHVLIEGEPLEYMYFGGAKELTLLRSDVKKKLVFEYSLSEYRGKEQLKGIVRAVVCEDTGAGETDLTAFENLVRSLAGVNKQAERVDSLNEFLAEKIENCAYGLCAVYFNRSTPEKFPALAGLRSDVFRFSAGSVSNCLLYAPAPDCDFSPYREVVFLDKPAAITWKTGTARLIVNEDICGCAQLRDLPAERDNLLAVFAQMRNAEIYGDSYAEAAKNCGALGFSNELFMFALAVFEELGLVRNAGGRYVINHGVKTDLHNSAAYNAWLRLQNVS